MKKRFLVNLIFVLILVISLGFSACGETSETPHEHSWSTEWSKNDIYHWHEPLCYDSADIKDTAKHNFIDDTCLVCGYVIQHKHSWSTQWSKDETYHWHAALCDDTTATQGTAKHNFVNNVCSVCGYEQDLTHRHKFVNNVCTECGELRNVSEIEQTSFRNVGEKYNTVVKPLYDAVQTIWQDLIDDPCLADVKDILTDEARNPKIDEFYYLHPTGFNIFISFDIFILEAGDINTENGEKSEFLRHEVVIHVENFNKADETETHDAYSDFLWAEHKLQGNIMAYVNGVLPYAERSAEMLLARYEAYKNSDDRKISLGNRPKFIVLSKNSSLSEFYEKTVTQLNKELEKKNYPLLTDQDVKFDFGWYKSDGIIFRNVQVSATIGNLYYSFEIDVSEAEFPNDYFYYFQGQLVAGYGTYSDWYNPLNEEYAEYFENLKIEETDFSDTSGQYNKDYPLFFANGVLHF